MKLLYIEDTRANVTVMARVAQHLEYDFVVAPTAADGLLQLQASPDVILVDISLPDLDGLSLIKAIRSRLSHTPIIAVTAHAMPDDKQRCLDAGCNEYVSKPFGWQMMLDLLRKYEALCTHQ